MIQYKQRLPICSATLAGFIAASLAQGVQAYHYEEEIPFDEASIFFELNDTDGDLVSML